MSGKKIFKLGLAGIFLAVVAYVLVAAERDMERIAEENGLDAEQTAAFRSCDRHMSGKEMVSGGMTLSRVPKDICVCQSRAMVAVFNGGEYSSHKNVVNYLGGKKKRKPLNSKHLKYPTSAEEEFDRLEQSLRRCVAEYVAEGRRRALESHPELGARQSG